MADDVFVKIEKLREKRDIKGLIKNLQISDFQISEAARNALIAIGHPGFQQLTKSFQDEKIHSIDIVLSGLAEDTTDRTLRDDILRFAIKCSQNKNKDVRNKTMYLLRNIKLPIEETELRQNAFNAIMNTFRTEKETFPDIRGMAMEALEWQYSDMVGEEFFLGALTDKNDNVRMHAGQGLGKLVWKPGLGEIGAVYYVARKSFEACEGIGFSATPALTNVLGWTPIFRDVTETLGRIGDRRAVIAIMEQIVKYYQFMQQGLQYFSWQGIEAAPYALAEISGEKARSFLRELSFKSHVIPTSFDTAVKEALKSIENDSGKATDFMVIIYSGKEPSPTQLLDIKQGNCIADEKKYRLVAALDAKGPLPTKVDPFIISCLLLLGEEFSIPTPAENTISYRVAEISDETSIGVVTYSISKY